MPGTDDGIASAARFTSLVSLRFDATGQIMYICDNHAIRQMVMSNCSGSVLVFYRTLPRLLWGSFMGEHAANPRLILASLQKRIDERRKKSATLT